MKHYTLVLTGGIKFKCVANSLDQARKYCKKLHGKSAVAYWYAFM